jgi:hypothetical protein
MTHERSHDIDPVPEQGSEPVTAPSVPRPGGLHQIPGSEGQPLSDARHSRRNLLLAGLGLGGAYAVDRTNLLVNAADALNPFNNAPEAPSKPLTPEKYEIAIPWMPETVKRWQEPIIEMAHKYQIDPELIAIIMTVESGGYSRAHSAADAKGLMQITPPAEADIASKWLIEPTNKYDIWDPKMNIEFGTAYLNQLRVALSDEDIDTGLYNMVELLAAGYNGGPGAAGSLLTGKGLDSEETLQHSRDVLSMWRERRAAISPTYNRWLERGGKDLVALAQGEK